MSVVQGILLAVLLVPLYLGLIALMGASIQYLQAMTMKARER